MNLIMPFNELWGDGDGQFGNGRGSIPHVRDDKDCRYFGVGCGQGWFYDGLNGRVRGEMVTQKPTDDDELVASVFSNLDRRLKQKNRPRERTVNNESE